MNGTEKKETYNQNNIIAKDETSTSYQEIIKYFRYGVVLEFFMLLFSFHNKL